MLLYGNSGLGLGFLWAWLGLHFFTAVFGLGPLGLEFHFFGVSLVLHCFHHFFRISFGLVHRLRLF